MADAVAPTYTAHCHMTTGLTVHMHLYALKVAQRALRCPHRPYFWELGIFVILVPIFLCFWEESSFLKPPNNEMPKCDKSLTVMSGLIFCTLHHTWCVAITSYRYVGSYLSKGGCRGFAPRCGWSCGFTSKATDVHNSLGTSAHLNVHGRWEFFVKPIPKRRTT